MIDYVLFAALIISLITDLWSRRILNIVTLPAIAFGLIYHVVTGGWEGLIFSGKGFLAGLLLLLIPFALGGMGAGDVKLLTAIGTLKGSAFVFQSFLLICIMGGIMAVMAVIIKGQLKTTAKRMLLSLRMLRMSPSTSLQLLDQHDFHSALPYAVPIVLGTISCYFWSGV